ncbi:peptidoglycan-binding protein [Bacteroidia bacterium]|nr:peptidoglycan-binding protein [Bacteroidia bacterium]
MVVLRKGSQGTTVAQLQEILKKKGYPVQPDGVFGQQTYIAVCQYQEKNGLTADGIVGNDTWNLLSGKNATPPTPPTPVSQPVTNAAPPAAPQTATLDYAETAALLDVEEAAIRAVCEIESGGRTGFFKDGRPIILFEGHIFWRELKKRGIDPEKYQTDYRDVLFQKWDKSSYKGGAAEYDRMNKAATINEEAAWCSASWGMFQIMGFNHKLCGYDSVREYVQAVKANSNNHLLSFAHFLKSTGIDKPLRTLDWAGFASRYNGPGYKQNQYDVKLQNAYLKYKKQ